MRIAQIRKGTALAAMGAGLALVSARPAAAQTTGDTTATQATTTTDRDDDGPDLGWIGLLGLAGLAGLRRREPTVVHRETVHPEPRR
jgi:MYXO-CTERM domain-containing protein